MASRSSRPGAYALTAVIALVGALLIAATIIWGWGHVAYALGIAALVIGCVGLVVLAIPNRVAKVLVGAVVAAVVIAGGVVVVTGVPSEIARWDDPEADGPGGWSASVGNLFISGGTARDIQSGAVVWEHEGEGARPWLVTADLVVIGSDDGSVGIETETGRELWSSAITGRGITHDENVLVVAHSVPDAPTESVALDLATGETVWQRPGRPVMECDLGATDRFSPAPERSHVLVIPDWENDRRADVVDLADGSTTITDVDCSVTARIVDGVLLLAVDSNLTALSLVDGAQLWATPVTQTWRVVGGGPTVFTPTATSDQSSEDLIAIDVATGEARAVNPPVGTPTELSGLEIRTSPEVWILVVLKPGAALWNPGTDQLVNVPNATTIREEGIDAFSGWMAFSGTTRDLTGESSSQCWALSQTGTLYGPFPGENCVVAEGLLQSTEGIFPLE